MTLTLQVPILGYETDPVSGIVDPLAGTMESVHGNETVPITIGEKAYDQASGQVAPVCGVRKNQESGVVVPVTQNPEYGSGMKNKVIPRSVVSSMCVLARTWGSCNETSYAFQ